jgi:hypothetical protein
LTETEKAENGSSALFIGDSFNVKFQSAPFLTMFKVRLIKRE